MSKVLLTGIPSPRIFYAHSFEDFSIQYRSRKSEQRQFSDVLQDMEISGNTGNLLIGEGAAGALSSVDYDFVPFWYLLNVIKDERRLAALRERFSKVVMATANIFRSDHSAHAEAEVLEKINLPTLLMGAGIQLKENLGDVPEGTLRLIEFLKGDEHHVFTRGEQSAQFLRDKGVNNITPTGCPSIYLRPEQMKSALRKVKNLSTLDFGSVMIGGYIGHAATNRDINFLKTISRDIRFVLQDEFLHYGLEIDHENWVGRSFNPVSGEVLVPYRHRSEQAEDFKPSIHIFTDTDDWRAWAGEHDVFFGRRFHGGIAAMQAEVPALFVSIDDRMREMLDLMGFPQIDTTVFTPHEDKTAVLREWITSIDTEALVKKYEKRERSFRTALKKLGLR